MTKKTRAKARRALLTLSLVLVMMMVAVGGTIAWLTAGTTEVVNTFSPSTINIELKEHDYNATSDALGTTEVTAEADYKMVPGKELDKDPFVRVKANSENCYVFVTVTKANDFDTFITATINTNAWTYLKNEENGAAVYYYGTDNALTKVESSTSDRVLTNILTGNKVKVNDAVTKARLDAVTANTKPTITFDAYAIQSENLTAGLTIDQIWDLAKTAANPTTGN